jgi:hypothetical protein
VPSRRLLTVAAGLATVFVAAVLISGYAGVAPWSGSMPFGHPEASSSSSTSSFWGAEGSAAALLTTANGAPWSPVLAAGFALEHSITLPGGNSTTNQSFLPGCSSTSSVGSSASLTIPSTPNSAAPGLAAAWLFVFTDSEHNLSVVVVLGTQVSVFQTATAAACGPMLAQYSAISPAAIDSTQAAATADAWGGTAFRANTTSVNAIYSVQGAMTYPNLYSGIPCGNNSSSGSGAPPPCWGPPPVPPTNYSVPSSWSVSYTSCVPYAIFSSCSGPVQMFGATIDPLNDTVRTVFAFEGGAGYPILNPGGPSMGPPPTQLGHP